MSKSIISNDKKCLVCGTTYDIHKHHIFFGTANRKNSEKYGCWCYLCGRHHNLSGEGVHYNIALNLDIKRMTQKRFEELYSHERFIQVFGKSYL